MPPRKKRKNENARNGDHEEESKTKKGKKTDKPLSNNEELPDELEPNPGRERVKKALFPVTKDKECNYWLMKSEPGVRYVKNVDVSFSIEALMEEENQTAEWDGVRNSESCNNLKSMLVGDIVFFYHSNCRNPGIVGMMEIVRGPYPDESQFHHESPFYDSKSTRENPKWFSVDVKFMRRFKNDITLSKLRRYQSLQLSNMPLFNRPRLSVQPITKQQFDFILQLDLVESEDGKP